MQTLHMIMVVVQVISALSIIALVLLQHGKGADMGASFGSGASGSLFGATGASNFLTKSTAFAATVFLVVTLALTATGNKPKSGLGVMEGVVNKQVVPNNATAAPASSVTATPASGSQVNEIPK